VTVQFLEASFAILHLGVHLIALKTGTPRRQRKLELVSGAKIGTERAENRGERCGTVSGRDRKR